MEINFKPLRWAKEFGQSLKPVAQGAGDILTSAYWLPHDVFNYVTGCDEKWGERNSWFTGFLKYRNHRWDGPIYRIGDTAARFFYGAINTVSWGGTHYVFNQKIGLNIEYFSPPPKDAREQTRYFLGGLLALFPVRAPIIRALGKEKIKSASTVPTAKNLPGETYDVAPRSRPQILPQLSPKILMQQTWKAKPFHPALPSTVETSAGKVTIPSKGFLATTSTKSGNVGGSSGASGALQPSIPTSQRIFLQAISERRTGSTNPAQNLNEATNTNASPFTLHASRTPPIPFHLPSSQTGEIKEPNYSKEEWIVLPGATKKEGAMGMPSAFHDDMVEPSENQITYEFSLGTEVAMNRVVKRLMDWEGRRNAPGELFKQIEGYARRYPQIFFTKIDHPLNQATPEEIAKETAILQQQIRDADYMLPDAYENYLLQLYSYALLIKSGKMTEQDIYQGLHALFAGFASFHESDIKVSFIPDYRGPNLLHWEAHLREIQEAIGRPHLNDLQRLAASSNIDISLEGQTLTNQQKKDFYKNYQEMFGSQLPRYPEIHGMASLAFQDLQNGLPIRPFVLSYTGSNELRSFQFIANSPVEETFPLNYFPLEDYFNIVPNRLEGYDISRGGTNLTIEFYLSPPELLMMLSKYKELLEDNRSLAAIQGGMVNLFRSLLRIYNIPIRLISHSYPEIPSPGLLEFPQPMGFWEAAFAAKNKILATYLSPRNPSLNVREQAYRWSLEMGLALKLDPKLNQLAPTRPHRKPK